MKEKIKKILIPWRENLEKKWWHRLVNVIIYGSTICVAIFLFILFLNSSFWKKTNYIYSFEPTYNTVNGKEGGCIFSNTGNMFTDFRNKESGNPFLEEGHPTLMCGGATLSSKDFLMKYDKSGSFDKINEKLADATLRDMEKSGKLSDIKVKKYIEIIYTQFFKEIVMVILYTFLWFIFWESIIYRVILYIIYGKNKTI